jgi:hypothetical protein
MATTRTSTAAVIAAILTVGGCGGGGGGDGRSHVPSAAEIGGTYDLTTTVRGGTEPSRSGVGVVGVGDELHLELSEPLAALSGALERNGSLRLEGRTTGSDVIEPLQATARVRRIDDTYWITGTIQTLDVDFAMSRPVGSDLQNASGRYRLTFSRSFGRHDGPSVIDLTADVSVGGSAKLAAGHEVDARGNELADLSFGMLDVAPSGRFHLETTYADPNGGCGAGPEGTGPCVLRVDGQLPESGATAAARAELLGGLRMQVAAGEIQIERTP